MSWLKRLTIETLLPRILAVGGGVSGLVHIFLSEDNGKFTYSHGSYVALGISIGFWSSAVISMLLVWLLKGKKQQVNSPVLH